MAEIDSDMNLIMNMLLTKLTVKQTLLEDRDKQLGIWREWTIYFWVNYDDTTNITLNLRIFNLIAMRLLYVDEY